MMPKNNDEVNDLKEAKQRMQEQDLSDEQVNVSRIMK
jgi:hypothetical protein